MPKISVVLPVFKAEEFLRRALNSLQAQTFSDWEVICVNDCTPDKSQDIVDEYMRLDKRIHSFKLEKNSGPGVVRNVAIEHATGEYILFMDSDDFLHPQTMELVYGLAKRDKSDMVSYTYDRSYRPQLMIRQLLKLPYKNAVPFGIKKKYHLEKIESLTTNEIIEHVTENSHTSIKWSIKHCQAWKVLIRREFLKGVKFPPIYIYEDFPWWMSVVLKRPRTTITQLPIYFYYPNFGSIILSYKQLVKFKDLCTAINTSFDMLKNASDKEKTIIMREFIWRFMIHAFHFLGRVGKENAGIVREKFTEMYNKGMLDNPTTMREKYYKRKILKFINK